MIKDKYNKFICWKFGHCYDIVFEVLKKQGNIEYTKLYAKCSRCHNKKEV